MKNLYHYCVQVNTLTEQKIACEFYRRASKRPLHPQFPSHSPCGYVGMDANRKVAMNTSFFKYPYETAVDFKNIDMLADSPARHKALAAAYKKYNYVGVAPVKVEEKPKKVPSKMLPVVTFWYPSSVTRRNVERKVRVVKADTIHIIGFDINNNNQFKMFKRAKVSGLISLVAFNS